MARYLACSGVFDGSCDPSLGRVRLTRTGNVDVVNFLEVIGQWGPCE
jgi:hypothetical protein